MNMFGLEERGQVHSAKEFAGLRLVGATHEWMAARSDRDRSKAATALAEAHAVYRAASDAFEYATTCCDAWALREQFHDDERERLEEERKMRWHDALARARTADDPDASTMGLVASLLIELLPKLDPCKPNEMTVTNQWRKEIERQAAEGEKLRQQHLSR